MTQPQEGLDRTMQPLWRMAMPRSTEFRRKPSTNSFRGRAMAGLSLVERPLRQPTWPYGASVSSISWCSSSQISMPSIRLTYRMRVCPLLVARLSPRLQRRCLCLSIYVGLAMHRGTPNSRQRLTRTFDNWKPPRAKGGGTAVPFELMPSSLNAATLGLRSRGSSRMSVAFDAFTRSNDPRLTARTLFGEPTGMLLTPGSFHPFPLFVVVRVEDGGRGFSPPPLIYEDRQGGR